MTPVAAGLVQRAASLYLGAAGSVLASLPGTWLYFSVDAACKKRLKNTRLDPVAPLLSSALAGLTSAVLKVPADVVKHRVQAYRATNVVAAAAAARVRGLYSGFGATLLRDVPELVIQFAAYEHLHGMAGRMLPAPLHGRQQRQQRRSMTTCVAGALAGALAAVATTPLDAIKTSLQCGGQTSFRSALAGVLRTRGPAGLFAGMAPRVVQTSLQSAVFFLCFEASGAGVVRGGAGGRRVGGGGGGEGGGVGEEEGGRAPAWGDKDGWGGMQVQALVMEG